MYLCETKLKPTNQVNLQVLIIIYYEPIKYIIKSYTCYFHLFIIPFVISL